MYLMKLSKLLFVVGNTPLNMGRDVYIFTLLDLFMDFTFYYMLIVDAYSKWPEIVTLKIITATQNYRSFLVIQYT